MKFAKTDEDIKKCFGVLSKLRPHLSEKQFLDAVSRMYKTGYVLVFMEQANEVVSVAGIRTSEWLHTGKYLEIEDFITKEECRSKGIGSTLFKSIVSHARENQCKQLRLVSGVKREEAHKFYLKMGMIYEAKYFSFNIT